MSQRKDMLILEAALLVAPVVLLLIWAIPTMLFAVVFQFANHVEGKRNILDGLFGYAGVIGGVGALFFLIRLVRKTIRDELFNFGVWFWLWMGVGLYATHYLHRITNTITTVLIVLPLLALVVHFSIIQLKIRRSRNKWDVVTEEEK